MSCLGIWHFAPQHVQEIGGMIAITQRRNGLSTLTNMLPGCHNRGYNRCQTHSASLVCCGSFVCKIGVKSRESRNRGAQNVHRGRLSRQYMHEFNYLPGQFAASLHLRLYFLELGSRRQNAMPEQVNRLFKARIKR